MPYGFTDRVPIYGWHAVDHAETILPTPPIQGSIILSSQPTSFDLYIKGKTQKQENILIYQKLVIMLLKTLVKIKIKMKISDIYYSHDLAPNQFLHTLYLFI